MRQVGGVRGGALWGAGVESGDLGGGTRDLPADHQTAEGSRAKGRVSGSELSRQMVTEISKRNRCTS